MDSNKKPATVLRMATPGDAQGVLDIYGPIIEKTIISFEMDVPPVEKVAMRMEQILRVFPWLIARDGLKIAGYAYAGKHRKREAYRYSTEVSVCVHPDYHRQGIARRLYLALLRIIKAQGFYTAYAGVSLPNPASVAFHEGLGFEPVGVYKQAGFKFGEWVDVGWWQLLLREGDGEPGRLKHWSEVEMLEKWLSDADFYI